MVVVGADADTASTVDNHYEGARPTDVLPKSGIQTGGRVKGTCWDLVPAFAFLQYVVQRTAFCFHTVFSAGGEVNDKVYS